MARCLKHGDRRFSISSSTIRISASFCLPCRAVQLGKSIIFFSHIAQLASYQLSLLTYRSLSFAVFLHNFNHNLVAARNYSHLTPKSLTLTEASRAYLMEPHWNPTIEEQALARIDRIGQIRQVTTVRFYIRDSFEERVMEVQESKKNLAGVLLSGHDGGHADDSLGALHRLRALL
jgi:SNF2 family DNA or RNA helicase